MSQSPLLDIGIDKATGVVWNITGPQDMTLFEVEGGGGCTVLRGVSWMSRHEAATMFTSLPSCRLSMARRTWLPMLNALLAPISSLLPLLNCFLPSAPAAYLDAACCYVHEEASAACTHAQLHNCLLLLSPSCR